MNERELQYSVYYVRVYNTLQIHTRTHKATQHNRDTCLSNLVTHKCIIKKETTQRHRIQYTYYIQYNNICIFSLLLFRICFFH